MGARSRRKGADAEREVVRLARAAGLPARRCWELAQSPDPTERARDVRIGSDFYQVQVARDGFERIYAELEGVRGFIFRRDHDEWIVALTFADFLSLLGLEREARHRAGGLS